jgi:hypothetical protein
LHSEALEERSTYLNWWNEFFTAPHSWQTNPPGGRAGDRPGAGDGAADRPGDCERPGDGERPTERFGDTIKWVFMVASISAGGDGDAVKGVSLVSGVFSVDGPVDAGGVE